MDAPPAVPTPAPTPAAAVAFAFSFSSAVIGCPPSLALRAEPLFPLYRAASNPCAQCENGARADVRPTILSLAGGVRMLNYRLFLPALPGRRVGSALPDFTNPPGPGPDTKR